MTPMLMNFQKYSKEAEVMREEVEMKRRRLQHLLQRHLQRHNLQVRRTSGNGHFVQQTDEDQDEEEVEDEQEDDSIKYKHETTMKSKEKEDDGRIRLPLPFVAFTTSQRAHVNITMEKDGSEVRIGLNGHPFHFMDDGDVLEAVGL